MSPYCNTFHTNDDTYDAEQILSGKIPYHHYPRDAQVIGAIFRGETPPRPDDPRVTDCRWVHSTVLVFFQDYSSAAF